jgi:hypothetical protein
MGSPCCCSLNFTKLTLDGASATVPGLGPPFVSGIRPGSGCSYLGALTSVLVAAIGAHAVAAIVKCQSLPAPAQLASPRLVITGANP